MAQVKWLRSALLDLEEIGEYYARESPNYADIFTENVFAAANRLKLFPMMGRVVREIKDESIREIIYRYYRVIYWYDESDDVAEILTVFHSSRQFGGLPNQNDDE
jgi:toxin ParE1/3/4